MAANGAEIYTPGDHPSVTSFMERRSLSSHAAFFGHLLWPGARVLDCGCGPGSITAGIADRIGTTGIVTGIDANPDQVELARRRLSERANAAFRVCTVYDLPFPANSFDAVFSHALFEHLSDPPRAARELARVARPGGVVALRSPDWDGTLAGPLRPGLREALDRYAGLQSANGGDLRIGKQLGRILRSAGLESVRVEASFECYEPVSVIADYLARRMETVASLEAAARTLREWREDEGAFFAQAWCEATARKPLSTMKEIRDDERS